ncbi:MAG: NFACT family protein [Peptococcaceae bacterium]|nr:NFACT family protein [Peptococcaceae bacterium]
MSLDSLTLHHLVRELSPQLIGARVDRVQQPEKYEIHLSLRPQVPSGHPFPGPLRLLLNAGAACPRLHTTETAKKNPSPPPMFCMILRKHLEGARLLDIRQAGLDRVVILLFQNYNEQGDLQEYHLHLEIMGKHSNLILINPQTHTILDGIRRYSHTLSRHREILPGRPYIPPPPQQKILPIDETPWIEALFTDPNSLDHPLASLLLKTFTGMSPELARELVARAGLSPDTTLNMCGHIDLSRLYQAYADLLLRRDTTSLAPALYYAHTTQHPPTAFSFTPYVQYAGLRALSTSTLNQALRLFYESHYLAQKQEASRSSLRRVIQDACAHACKKVTLQQDTIAKAERTLPTCKTGELIMANLYRIPPQATEITVEDYLRDTPTYPLVTIPLDPQLTPTENAQLYYRRYNKAKATLEKTAPLLQASQTEYTYLQSLLVSIDLAQTPQELSEIHAELTDQKYLGKTPAAAKTHSRVTPKSKSSKSKSSKSKSQNPKSKSPASEPPSRPHHYLSSTGNTIIVGRNNTQNDRMTWRDARPHDLWLHVKNIPGSHVIVPLAADQEFPDDATLLEAATLAIHFSQAANSSHVPVDYTHVAQIKKPKGAKPGMVVYDQNWSLFLTPDADVVTTLLATEGGQRE